MRSETVGDGTRGWHRFAGTFTLAVAACLGSVACATAPVESSESFSLPGDSSRAPAAEHAPAASARRSGPAATQATATYPERMGMRLGLAPSFLPNMGVQVTADWPVWDDRFGTWRFEVQAVDQFLDDETFSNDGNPSAGNWTQFALGLRLVRNPRAEGTFEYFLGPIVFHARGRPNLVELPGTYVGIRGGLGYNVHLGPRLVMGPEFAVVVARSSRDNTLFPQLAWGLRWGGFGR